MTIFTRILKKRKKRIQQRFCHEVLDSSDVEMVRLGSAYGGWHIPSRCLREGGNAVCVGAGEDISLDVELNARHGMNVFTVDPTPRAEVHISDLLGAANAGASMPINGCPETPYELDGFQPDRFTFVAKGIWKEDCVMPFFVPRDPTGVSHSIVNLQQTEHYFEAECQTLRSLCKDQGINEIDILKMDIEGAEYRVIENLISDEVFPDAICIEFDEGNTEADGYMKRIKSAVNAIKKAGYLLCNIEGWNFVFIRKPL